MQLGLYESEAVILCIHMTQEDPTLHNLSCFLAKYPNFDLNSFSFLT